MEAWKVLARDAEILELVGIKNLIPLRSYSEESSRASTFELQKKGVNKSRNEQHVGKGAISHFSLRAIKGHQDLQTQDQKNNFSTERKIRKAIYIYVTTSSLLLPLLLLLSLSL